jgi:uncharacterized protein YegJ (DUF2314 family)
MKSSSQPGSSRITIPYPKNLQVGFVVYLKPGGSLWNDKENLRKVILEWAAVRANDAMQDIISRHLDEGWLNIQAGRKDEFPVPSEQDLNTMSPGKRERDRFNDATHAIVFRCNDMLVPPLMGFWTTAAAARAVALEYSGVVLSPMAGRFLNVKTYNDDIPESTLPPLVQFLAFPCSTGPDKTVWMTTIGMRGFSLPELELQDVPASLISNLIPFLSGAAEKILLFALQQGHRAKGELDELFFLQDMNVTGEDIAFSFGQRFSKKQKRWSTSIQISLRVHDENISFLTVSPPADFDKDVEAWYYELLGSQEEADSDAVLVSPGDSRLQEAIEQAREELDTIHKRFQDGLPGGHTLYVKHAFTTPDDSREHMWLIVNEWDDTGITGLLANEPAQCTDLEAGNMVKVSEDNVTDWMIVDASGILEGGYTMDMFEGEG